MESLASKYRPKTFSDVSAQKSIIAILKKQLETGNVTNCYLFAGPTGTGKTTLARIFADKINGGIGSPIEIDGASNNGVDNIRQIISAANERSLEATYKIYIIDECHQITTAAWNAFLKCLEEPPEYTIFILCTTDPQKIPATIMNRVMRFNLNKIPTDEIEHRLNYICEQEGFTDYKEACNYLAKLSLGGMRDAISMLEKCSKYSTSISIKNVLQVVGNVSYDTFLGLTDSLIERNEGAVINYIDNIFSSGIDMRVFIEQYLDFILDMTKYCIFKDIAVTKIPSYLEKNVKYSVGFEGNIRFYNMVSTTLLELKNKLRYDVSPRTTILATFIGIIR